MQTNSAMSSSGLPFDRLAAPARRALEAAGIATLHDLATRSEREIAALHGIGPNALKVLRAALVQQGLGFSD